MHRMSTLDYGNGVLFAAILVACVPLFVAGCGVALFGALVADLLLRNRQRIRREKMRRQRLAQRETLRKLKRETLLGNLQRANKGDSAQGNPPGVNPSGKDISPPSAEEVARQWDRTHDSLEEMVGFGIMLLRLECAVDSSFIMGKDDDGNPVIVGRNPGLKGWLAEHCPHIGYKTAMRYKSLALKSLQSKKGKSIVARSETLIGLQESLYKVLNITHYSHEKPYARRKVNVSGMGRTGRGRDACQALIFDVRARALGEFRERRPPPQSREMRRVVAAFTALTEELKSVP